MFYSKKKKYLGIGEGRGEVLKSKAMTVKRAGRGKRKYTRLNCLQKHKIEGKCCPQISLHPHLTNLPSQAALIITILTSHGIVF